MKITKLLPIALAFAMTTGIASADLTTKDKVDYEITVPEYYDIVAAFDNNDATATVTGKYEGLTLDGAMDGNFTVITNMPADTVYLYAECQAGANKVNAMYGTAAAPKIIFTKEGGVANLANGTAEELAKGQATSEDAIAFNLTVGTIEKTGNLAAATPTWAGDATHKSGIKYTLKNGKYVFNYSIAEDALDATTFDVDDSQGTYKATLFMQRTQL